MAASNEDNDRAIAESAHRAVDQAIADGLMEADNRPEVLAHIARALRSRQAVPR